MVEDKKKFLESKGFFSRAKVINQVLNEKSIPQELTVIIDQYSFDPEICWQILQKKLRAHNIICPDFPVTLEALGDIRNRIEGAMDVQNQGMMSYKKIGLFACIAFFIIAAVFAGSAACTQAENRGVRLAGTIIGGSMIPVGGILFCLCCCCGLALPSHARLDIHNKEKLLIDIDTYMLLICQDSSKEFKRARDHLELIGNLAEESNSHAIKIKLDNENFIDKQISLLD